MTFYLGVGGFSQLLRGCKEEGSETKSASLGVCLNPLTTPQLTGEGMGLMR